MRAVPGRAVGVDRRRARVGQRRVHLPALAGSGQGVHGRPDQRVAERHVRPGLAQQSGAHETVDSGWWDREAVERAEDQVDRRGARDGADQHRAPLVGPQRGDLCGERPLQPVGAGQRLPQRRVAGPLLGGQRPRDLHECQRVAAGQIEELLDDHAGDDTAAAQQRRARLAVEAAEDDLREPGCVEGRHVPGGEHEQHGLGQQPARREQHRLGGGAVEPVRVVDEAEQRRVLRRGGQQGQRRGVHREPVDRRAGLAPCRGGIQRGRLDGRQVVEVAQQRPGERGQAGERQVRLELGAGRAHDAKPGRVRGQVVQQGGLADARGPPQDHRAAVPRSDLVAQVRQPAAFRLPPQEVVHHLPSLASRRACRPALSDTRPVATRRLRTALSEVAGTVPAWC